MKTKKPSRNEQYEQYEQDEPKINVIDEIRDRAQAEFALDSLILSLAQSEHGRIDPTRIGEIGELSDQLFNPPPHGEPTFLDSEKTLRITITDGDYTLREGIDYDTYCDFKMGGLVRILLTAGKGKYENIRLYGYAIAKPKEA